MSPSGGKECLSSRNILFCIFVDVDVFKNNLKCFISFAVYYRVYLKNSGNRDHGNKF